MEEAKEQVAKIEEFKSFDASEVLDDMICHICMENQGVYSYKSHGNCNPVYKMCRDCH